MRMTNRGNGSEEWTVLTVKGGERVGRKRSNGVSVECNTMNKINPTINKIGSLWTT